MKVAFDTLKFAQTLRDKARVPQDQAEEIALAFADATGEQIVTNSDLLSLQSEFKATELRLVSDLRATEARLEAKISEVRYELLSVKWMMGFVLAFQVGIIVKLFVH